MIINVSTEEDMIKHHTTSIFSTQSKNLWKYVKMLSKSIKKIHLITKDSWICIFIELILFDIEC